MSESLVAVYVSRGRTVTTGSWPALNRHGPGSQVQLPIEDAVRLRAGGFVQDKPPILNPSATTPNPAAIGHVDPNINAQGPTYRR
jgi:hypothetical protein